MVYRMSGCMLMVVLMACGNGPSSSASLTSAESESQAFSSHHAVRSQLYPEDWTPGFKVDHPKYSRPLALQDYSYAGYRNGEVPVPYVSDNVKTVSTVTDGSADASEDIQQAIDEAVIAGGGVVYLPAGLYRIDRPLVIAGSHVVLRGAGVEATRLWFYRGGGTSDKHKANILVTGRKYLQEQAQPHWAIAAEGAVFDRYIKVKDTAGLAVGDDISIAWDITEAFKEEHNSGEYWYHTNIGSRKTFFRRTITRLEGNRVYFKVPLRYPVKLRDNPVLLRVSHYAIENGIESLSLTNAVGVKNAWRGFDQSSAILLRFCKDCWVRNIHSFSRENDGHHLRSHGITVNRSFRVTLADNVLQKPEHLGGGGNGYLFQLSQTNEVLVRDSTGIDGRHNFSINWDFGAAGNVFLRVRSRGGRVCADLDEQLRNACDLGPSDFHHALAMANLFDQAIIDDALVVGNRQDWSTGAGHTGTRNVFWNTRGVGAVYAYNQEIGYVIGTGPRIEVHTDLHRDTWPERYIAPGSEPEDFTEWLGSAYGLHPQSLYEDQLARRIGTR